jgi:hypothetical protein
MLYTISMGHLKTKGAICAESVQKCASSISGKKKRRENLRLPIIILTGCHRFAEKQR